MEKKVRWWSHVTWVIGWCLLKARKRSGVVVGDLNIFMRGSRKNQQIFYSRLLISRWFSKNRSKPTWNGAQLEKISLLSARRTWNIKIFENIWENSGYEGSWKKDVIFSLQPWWKTNMSFSQEKIFSLFLFLSIETQFWKKAFSSEEMATI